MGDGSERGDVAGDAEVRRGHDVDPGVVSAGAQGSLQVVGVDASGCAELVVDGGCQPVDVGAGQDGTVEDGGVDVALGQYPLAAAGEREHGRDVGLGSAVGAPQDLRDAPAFGGQSQRSGLGGGFVAGVDAVGQRGGCRRSWRPRRAVR